MFSTNAAPFEAEMAYTPFAAYAMLEHRGDFAAAARILRDQGYGSQAPSPDYTVSTRPYRQRVFARLRRWSA